MIFDLNKNFYRHDMNYSIILLKISQNKYPKREELKNIADSISESISKVQNWFKYYRIKTNSIIPSLKVFLIILIISNKFLKEKENL